MGSIYPHRWAVPRETWARFFESAEHEVGILAYSALFLAEDAGIVAILARKGSTGVTVRITLGTPRARTLPGAAMRKASAMPCLPKFATH
jgi:hypothetical protein